MARELRGHAHCIDGVLDVDWDISPLEDAHFLTDATVQRIPSEILLRHLAEHCLTRIDPEFPRKVRPGDFLVGNRGVGWGHGHDQAILALKGVGIGAVLCETTTVNFKRNCIHHGLPLIEIPGIFGLVSTGDELELELGRGILRNLTSRAVLEFVPYPEFILEILDAGGIYEQLQATLENEKAAGNALIKEGIV
jgi:3-isopropylmalate/(R)-2-methylmalate dehydratase small subunit